MHSGVNGYRSYKKLGSIMMLRNLGLKHLLCNDVAIIMDNLVHIVPWNGRKRTLSFICTFENKKNTVMLRNYSKRTL